MELTVDLLELGSRAAMCLHGENGVYLSEYWITERAKL